MLTPDSLQVNALRQVCFSRLDVTNFSSCLIFGFVGVRLGCPQWVSAALVAEFGKSATPTNSSYHRHWSVTSCLEKTYDCFFFDDVDVHPFLAFFVVNWSRLKAREHEWQSVSREILVWSCEKHEAIEMCIHREVVHHLITIFSRDQGRSRTERSVLPLIARQLIELHKNQEISPGHTS